MKEISINQLADFSKATPRGKERIIHQQKYPNKVKVFWYQNAKAKIKKSLAKGGDLKPVYLGLEEIMKKNPEKDWQKSDKKVSIEALERYIKMGIPKMLKDFDYYVVKPQDNCFQVDGVKIIVAPDVVYAGVMNGERVIGGLKVHISKTKPFEKMQGALVATSIMKFLEQRDEFSDYTVHPGLCMSVDIFAERVIAASAIEDQTFIEIKNLCQEIKELWDVA